MSTAKARTYPSGGQGDSANAERKRARIVSSAAELFDEVGYHPTTVDDIARAVGLAKPTLYHYFGGKDAILLGIHEEFIELLLSGGRAREQLGQQDVSEKLYHVMYDILDLMRTHRGHVRAFFDHHRELPEGTRATAEAKRDDYFRSVRRLFELGQERGELAGDPELSAMALFGMCNWAYQWFNPNGRYTSEQVARYFHNVLLHGISS